MSGRLITSADLATAGGALKGVPNRVAVLGNSVVAQGAIPRNGYSDTGWTPSTVVALNAYVAPKCIDLTNGYSCLRYKATTGGTTGSVEPVWPLTTGATVTDGTVVYTSELIVNTPGWPPGFWTFAQALSGQRLDEVYIMGRSGDTSDVILSYLSRVLAANPDIIYFANIFENDCWPGSAPVLSTIIARWNAFVAAADSVRALGKRIIVQTLLPSGNIDATSTFTGYSRGNGTKAWVWLNQKIREYARQRSDVVFFDAATLYVDTNPANPVWPENSTTYLVASGSNNKLTDGIHPYVSAAWKIGAALAAVLSANFPPVGRFGVAAEENQRAPNPFNYGTAGTNGTNASGQVANSITANAFSISGTVTGVNSKVTRTDNIAGSWQRMVYDASAGVADNASASYTSNITMSPIAVGDIVQAFGEMRFLANPIFLGCPSLWVRFLGATTVTFVYAISSWSTDQDVGQMIASDTTFLLKTVPVAVPASTTSLNLFAKGTARSTAVFTMDVGRVVVGKTVVPALS